MRHGLLRATIAALLLAGCGSQGGSVQISSRGAEEGVAPGSDPDAAEVLRSAASRMISVGMFSFVGTISKSDEELRVDGVVASPTLAQMRIQSTASGEREIIVADRVMYVRSDPISKWVALHVPLRVVGVNPASLLPALEHAIAVTHNGDKITFGLDAEVSQRLVLTSTPLTEPVTGEAVVTDNWIERLVYRSSTSHRAISVDLTFGPSSPGKLVTVPTGEAVESSVDMADTGSS